MICLQDFALQRKKAELKPNTNKNAVGIYDGTRLFERAPTPVRIKRGRNQ